MGPVPAAVMLLAGNSSRICAVPVMLAQTGHRAGSSKGNAPWAIGRSGCPQAKNFEIVAVPGNGQVLVRNRFLPVEPAMRGWVSSVANYAQPVGIGEVMRAFTAGEVIESRHPDYAPGHRVIGMFGWQTHAVVRAADIGPKRATTICRCPGLCTWLV